MKTFSVLALGTACSISLSFLSAIKPASALNALATNNHTFATRQVLPPNTTTVTGTLHIIAPPDSDFQTSGVLSEGHINTYTIKGHTPLEPFIALTDNVDGSITDTILGVFNESGSLIKSDDDSGRAGFSALSSSVNRDGTIRLAVTGYPDPHFTGHHLLSGKHYQLFVKFGTSTLPKLKSQRRDIDFYTFQNLTPESQFTAKITTEETFFPYLAWLDDSQKQLGFNYQYGKTHSAELKITVPKNGRVNLAIGSFFRQGRYTLVLTPVPISSNIPLLALGVLGIVILGAGIVGATAMMKHLQLPKSTAT